MTYFHTGDIGDGVVGSGWQIPKRYSYFPGAGAIIRAHLFADFDELFEEGIEVGVIKEGFRMPLHRH